MIMRKLQKPSRFCGLLAATAMLAGTLSAMPVSADGKFSGSDISECQYVMEVGKEVTTSDASETNGIATSIELSCASIGLPAGDTVSEVWVSFTGEAGKNIMPALGFYAPGYNEDNWYADSIIVSEGSGVVIFEIPEEYPMPDQFMIQQWWGDIDTFTVDAVGLMTASASSYGTVTRLGDCNSDRKIDIADAVALAAFLTSEKEFANPANADMDGSKTLDARDLALLKALILKTPSGPESGEGFNQTAMEYVSNIKIGWNLGNTLDALSDYAKSTYDFETAWGCPYTTKAMIDAVKKAGFNTVRVPVSWGQKMDSNYKINDDWMNRVQEVVDYVIDNDMYCILNIHHDNDIANHPYFYPDSEHLAQSEKFVTSVWTQISDRFKDYNDHLIFETLNEPRLIGHTNEWWIDSSNADCIDAMKCINTLNADALKTIRSSGSNNEKRFVMMPTYSASPDVANLNGMELPNDEHLIVSIHAYRPYNFALANDDTQTDKWNQATDASQVTDFLNAVKSRFLSKGIPVIIGEFGAMNRNNEQARAEWAEFYVKTADSYGIPCVWWDNNAFNGSGENFGLLNRGNCQIQYPTLLASLMKGAENRG